MTSGQPLYLGITATDMIKQDDEGTKDYWATNISGKSTSPVESNYNQSETSYSVSQVKLTGGDTGTKYHCVAKFNVKLTGLSGEFTENDGELKLTTETSTSNSGNVVANISDSAIGEPGVKEITHKLNSLVTLGDTGKDFYVVYDFIKTGSDDTADLKAAFKITNTQEDQTEKLAGKNITVTIATTEDGELTCEVVKGED